MATGYSFVDNNQISVREKIDRYFAKKNSAIPVVEIVDESTSDESSVDSITHFVSFIFRLFSMLAAWSG